MTEVCRYISEAVHARGLTTPVKPDTATGDPRPSCVNEACRSYNSPRQDQETLYA
jgi:hypothetical protein